MERIVSNCPYAVASSSAVLPKPGRRSGFTLIELLVAIGIIMILMAIGVFGLRSLEASASQKQTRVALGNAAGLLKEMESTGSYSRIEGLASLMPPPVYTLGQTVDATTYADVTPTKAGRTTAVAANKKVLDVLLVNPKIKQQVGSFSSNAILTADPGQPTRPTPILSDAWDNPIILVPSGGLQNVRFENDNFAAPRTITSSGQATSPANRAFWASAGPDGDFTKGDDNLYSFQN